MITTTPAKPEPSTAQSIDSTGAAIRAAGVCHTYQSRQALADLSLEIRSGELFAILGPNGSGKTTLFRLLSTLIPLQTGTVTVLGNDLSSEQSAIRRTIGVVFQAP